MIFAVSILASLGNYIKQKRKKDEVSIGHKTFMKLHSLKYHTNMQLISRDFSFTVLTQSSELHT